MRFYRFGLWALLLGFLLITVPMFQGKAEASQDKEAKLLLQALSFDKNIEKRSAKEIKIVVLYSGEKNEKVIEMVEGSENAVQDGIKGLNVTVLAFPFYSVRDLLKTVKNQNISGLYLDDSITRALPSIRQVTPALKIPSMAGNKKTVENGTAFAGL